MILNDLSIRNCINNDELGLNLVEPFNEDNLQPNSYDLTLGDEYLIDDKFTIREELLLEPNDFVLGTTREILRIPVDCCARVEGKSSTGRVGLLIHSTAGFVDAGFQGQITLEIKNIGNKPIKLYNGVRIAQVIFEQLVAPVERIYGEYDNHYQGQIGVQGSKYKLINGVYHVSEDTVENPQTRMEDFM